MPPRSPRPSPNERRLVRLMSWLALAVLGTLVPGVADAAWIEDEEACELAWPMSLDRSMSMLIEAAEGPTQPELRASSAEVLAWLRQSRDEASAGDGVEGQVEKVAAEAALLNEGMSCDGGTSCDPSKDEVNQAPQERERRSGGMCRPDDPGCSLSAGDPEQRRIELTSTLVPFLADTAVRYWKPNIPRAPRLVRLVFDPLLHGRLIVQRLERPPRLVPSL